jgi:hypothetical protein
MALSIPQQYKGRHRCQVFPIRPGDRSSYLGSMNVEITADGACPSYDHGAMSGSGDKLHYFVTALEAKGPAGNPRQYSFANDKAYRFEGGTLTEDEDFADVVQGAVIMDDDQTPPNERLVVFFGTGTTQDGHEWRDLGTDTTPWNGHAGATAVQAWVAERVGSDVYLVTGSAGQGRTVLGEHKITKVLAGIYDGTVDNVGPAEPVGHSDWPVISVAGLRDSLVAGKGSGAYYRNNTNLKYEPLRQLQENLASGLDCNAMAASENGVIYATTDGRLWEYDGRVEREITPIRDSLKPKDTQRGRIEFIADRGDVLAVGYAVAQPFLIGPRAAALGVRVFRRTAGTWAEITTDVTDGSYATPASANMNAWGGTATDRLLVISPVPLAAIIPRVTRAPNAEDNAFTNPQGSGGGAETAGALTVDLGSVIDFTILSAAGRSLVLTGFPPAAAEPLLGWDSLTANQDVEETTITVTGIGDVVGYGYEFSPANTTAMSTTTTIDEIDVVVGRPGLKLNDASGPFVAANDYSSHWASGMLTEIYFGRPLGNGQREWSVPYCVWTKGGGILAAAWTTASTGALTNGGQGLALYGRAVQMIIAEGQTRDPRRTRYPRLCQWMATEPGPRLTINNITFRHGDGSLADPSIPKRITRVTIAGRDIPPEDLQQVWVDSLDGRPPWKFGEGQGTNPIVISNESQGGAMRRGSLHLLYQDVSQLDEWAPLMEAIEIEWEYRDVQIRDMPPEAVAVV